MKKKFMYNIINQITVIDNFFGNNEKNIYMFER